MSHTDKDRPYWVKTNDPSMPRSPWHRHYLFGHTRSRWHLVRDNHGRPLMETVTEQRWLDRPGHEWSNMYRDPLRLPEDLRNHLFIAVYEDKEKPVYEIREVPYVDHCTIDEPNSTPSDPYSSPCSYHLENWVYSPYGPRSNRDERRFEHSRVRTRLRNSLRNHVKEVNGADDWDELDDSHLPQPERRHTIYWW